MIATLGRRRRNVWHYPTCTEVSLSTGYQNNRAGYRGTMEAIYAVARPIEPRVARRLMSSSAPVLRAPVLPEVCDASGPLVYGPGVGADVIGRCD